MLFECSFFFSKVVVLQYDLRCNKSINKILSVPDQMSHMQVLLILAGTTTISDEVLVLSMIQDCQGLYETELRLEFYTLR